MSRPVEQLINEVRLLYQSLIQVGDEIHRGSGISMGMRGVLEYLDRNGDATVPQMARARRVSRQRIQTLVNALRKLDLTAPVVNPASRRSPLVTLTAAGRKTIRDMRSREGREMAVTLAERRLLEAAETLAALRSALEKPDPD